MNPAYRFYLAVDSSDRIAVNPLFKDDLALEYAMETNQRFYRSKLSSKLTFVGDDYDLIALEDIQAEFRLYIQKSNDLGQTWADYYNGKFYLTDCTFNRDDRIVTVQPDYDDEYNDVLAGLEKEYNLIELAPSVERINICKRPVLQLYAAGDSIISCYLSNMTWEESVTEESDVTKLLGTYHFDVNCFLVRFKIANSTYVGRMVFVDEGGIRILRGELTNIADPEDERYVEGTQMMFDNRYLGDLTFKRIYRPDGHVIMTYNYGNDVTSETRGDIVMQCTRVYSRIVTDSATLNGATTYQLPADDMVVNNKNMHYCIGYNKPVGYISDEFSATPTKWGKADNSQYFAPPTALSDRPFFPLAQSQWRELSYWYSPDDTMSVTEVEGRKWYTLRDAYPLSSCISVLLKKIAPNITHEATAEYSEFLYGNYNPMGGRRYRLMVTPKSNITTAEYTNPAQKATTTLLQFLNMLRYCFQLYWWIEDGKLKIEHIKFFKNGGSYTGVPTIGTDLTQLSDIRNGKPWSFGTSAYSYDKVDMPERYTFAWMDEVTEPFTGQPIVIRDRFVSQGKIEEINVSNFTSDVDYMLLNPDEISQDGFALLAAVPLNGMLWDNPQQNTTSGRGSGSDYGETSPRLPLINGIEGKTPTITYTAYPFSGSPIIKIMYFDKDGNIIPFGQTDYDPSNIPLSPTHTSDATLSPIPVGAVKCAFAVMDGTVQVKVYGMTVNGENSVAIFEQTVNGVNYTLQNGDLAFIQLVPIYWLWDMPSYNITVNGINAVSKGIQRKKKQTLSYPVGNDDPNVDELVKTPLGNGEINKISINLMARTAKTTLNYDTE